MNRLTKIKLGGREYLLNFSVNATTAFDERFKDAGGIAEAETVLEKMSVSEQVQTVAWMLSVLIEQGAAYRRIVDGVNDCPTITADDIGVVLSPGEISGLTSAMFGAMGAGAETTVETENDPKNAEATQA